MPSGSSNAGGRKTGGRSGNESRRGEGAKRMKRERALEMGKQEAGGNKRRFVGVRQRPSGRWVAEIKDTTQKIRLWLGTFDSAEEGAKAYDSAARALRGANTRTNFVAAIASSACEATVSSKAQRLIRQRQSAAAANSKACESFTELAIDASASREDLIWDVHSQDDDGTTNNPSSAIASESLSTPSESSPPNHPCPSHNLASSSATDTETRDTDRDPHRGADGDAVLRSANGDADPDANCDADWDGNLDAMRTADGETHGDANQDAMRSAEGEANGEANQDANWDANWDADRSAHMDAKGGREDEYPAKPESVACATNMADEEAASSADDNEVITFEHCDAESRTLSKEDDSTDHSNSNNSNSNSNSNCNSSIMDVIPWPDYVLMEEFDLSCETTSSTGVYPAFEFSTEAMDRDSEQYLSDDSSDFLLRLPHAEDFHGQCELPKPPLVVPLGPSHQSLDETRESREFREGDSTIWGAVDLPTLCMVA